jgi:hypothetical protein
LCYLSLMCSLSGHTSLSMTWLRSLSIPWARRTAVYVLSAPPPINVFSFRLRPLCITWARRTALRIPAPWACLPANGATLSLYYRVIYIYILYIIYIIHICTCPLGMLASQRCDSLSLSLSLSCLALSLSRSLALSLALSRSLSLYYRVKHTHAHTHTHTHTHVYIYRWDSQVPTRDHLASLRSHISSLDEEERARVVMDFKVL